MSVVRYTNRPAPYEIMPEHFFENGEEGAFFIPRPKPRGGQTALYEDAGGMDPATESGDPVGFMRDLSGNGSHARQAVASARPTYRADNSRQGLLFDGVDDTLEAGQFNLMGDWLIGLAFRLEEHGSASANLIHTFGVFSGAVTQIGLAIRRQSSARIINGYARYNGGPRARVYSASNFDVGDITMTVMSLRGPSMALRVNGEMVDTTDGIEQASDNGTLQFMPDNDGGIFTIFGAAAIKGTHDTDKIERVERYLARLARTQL